MRARWFRFLVGLFPTQFRNDRGPEMIEALEASEHTLSESRSLLFAWPGAWNRHLKTHDGVRSAAALGAFVWLGLLLGAGPFARGLSAAVDPFRWGRLAGFETPPWLVWTAAILLALSVVVGLRLRTVALFLFAAGIAASAFANRSGNWTFSDSLLYESFWLGFAGVSLP